MLSWEPMPSKIVKEPGAEKAGAEVASAGSEDASADTEDASADTEEDEAAVRERLEAQVERFVALHAGRHRQRSEGWLAEKAGSIGGSEIAALMGRNPYTSFDAVVASKVGVRSFTGNIACRWGTLFESAIENFVAIDCGTRLAGTDISVPSPSASGLEGRHANSPDGYCVLALYAPLPTSEPDGADVWRIRFTDAETRAAAVGRPTKQVITLLEFKCPYRRLPKGEIPKHYKPQLWSGLALSPIARLGLFVDAAFRKCGLWSLGHKPGYDQTYHREREVAGWGLPIAWGLTAVYAPRLDAADAADMGDAADAADAADMADMADMASAVNAAYEAWLLHYKHFGASYESPQEAERAGRPFAPDPIDFGSCDKAIFEEAMLHVDKGRFRAEHCGPCFPDGRGAALNTSGEVAAAVGRLSAEAPAHHYLLGCIPWKIFEVDYVFIERRDGFLAEIAPLVHSCLDTAERLRREEDPARAYCAYVDQKRKAARLSGGAKKRRTSPAFTAEQLQDIYDSV